jgi:hypothetical protein
MNILVDFRPLKSRLVSGEAGRFILDKLTFLSEVFQGHHWYYLADSPWDEKKWGSPAHVQILSKKALPGIFGWKCWYRLQVPATSKKIHADLLISTGGVAAQVLINQIVWIPDPQGNETSGIRQNYKDLIRKKRVQTLHQASLLNFLSENSRQEWE